MHVEAALAPTTNESECPKDWRITRLGSVAEVRFSSVDKLTYSSERPVRLCNYIDVYRNHYITRALDFMVASASEAEIDRFSLRVGDVIITKDSETPDDIGVAAVVDDAPDDLICGYHLGLIRPKTDEVDPTFLAKQLAHPRVARYFGKQANGLTRYALPIGAVTNTPLCLPLLEEQLAIGAILRLMDEAIVRAEAVVTKLKQIQAGLLHDLLTRGIDDHGDLRDSTAQPKHFVDSALGRIPSEWVAAPLGSFLASTEYGISTSLSGDGTLPVLRMNNLANGEVKLDDLKFATRPIPQTLLLRNGDVLFNRTNSYEHVGRTGIWRQQLPMATFASYLVRLNPAVERLSSEFLNLLLNMPEAQQRMRQFATPAVQQVNINPTNLQIMLVAVPQRLSEQDAIMDSAHAIAQTVDAQEEELRKLIAIRSGVMANLLAGQVRVLSLSAS